MEKKHDPFNLAFLKYIAAVAAIYWGVHVLAEDHIRAVLQSSRNMAAFNAILLALIIDAAIAMAARFEFNQSGGGIFTYKVAVDAVIMLALFGTSSFGGGAGGAEAWSIYGLAYAVADICAWAMCFISAMVVMSWIVRR